MNNVILVGRLTSNPEINEYSVDKHISAVTLAVSRNYKNSDGIYDTDFVRCVLWNGIAKNTSEYCKIGDVIGVKGRLQSNEFIDKDGIKHYKMEVVAERVTFLSSVKPKDAVEISQEESKTETKIEVKSEDVAEEKKDCKNNKRRKKE